MTERKNQNYVRILIHQRCFANPKTERSRLAKRRLKNWSGKVQRWKKANPLSPRTITLSKLLLRIDMFHSFLYLTLFFGFKKAKKRQVRSTILQIKSFLFFLIRNKLFSLKEIYVRETRGTCPAFKREVSRG